VVGSAQNGSLLLLCCVVLCCVVVNKDHKRSDERSIYVSFWRLFYLLARRPSWTSTAKDIIAKNDKDLSPLSQYLAVFGFLSPRSTQYTLSWKSRRISFWHAFIFALGSLGEKHREKVDRVILRYLVHCPRPPVASLPSLPPYPMESLFVPVLPLCPPHSVVVSTIVIKVE